MSSSKKNTIFRDLLGPYNEFSNKKDKMNSLIWQYRVFECGKVLRGLGEGADAINNVAENLK